MSNGWIFFRVHIFAKAKQWSQLNIHHRNVTAVTLSSLHSPILLAVLLRWKQQCKYKTHSPPYRKGNLIFWWNFLPNMQLSSLPIIQWLHILLSFQQRKDSPTLHDLILTMAPAYNNFIDTMIWACYNNSFHLKEIDLQEVRAEGWEKSIPICIWMANFSGEMATIIRRCLTTNII